MEQRILQIQFYSTLFNEIISKSITLAESVLEFIFSPMDKGNPYLYFFESEKEK